MEEEEEEEEEEEVVPKEEGYLMTLIKSTWYLGALVLLLFAAAVIFMGIEGNHQNFESYKLLEEQAAFTQRLDDWLQSDKPRAEALRKNIGLTPDLLAEEYDLLIDKQQHVNVSRILLIVGLRCAWAKHNLTAWNNKTQGDALMYAASILSTVGWGIYHPPDTRLKIITLLYMAFGIPIFAALINHCTGFVTWLEEYFIKRKWVQKYMGDDRLISGVMILFIIIVLIIYGLICDWLVETERESILETALVDTGQNYSWNFLISLYYTIQTVTTIGFGDIYIYSPGHALLNIKPIICLLLTSFLIAVFARIFFKLQASVENVAAKETLKTRGSVGALRLGVISVNSRAAANLDEIREDAESSEGL